MCPKATPVHSPRIVSSLVPTVLFPLTLVVRSDGPRRPSYRITLPHNFLYYPLNGKQAEVCVPV
jgi:hypothetical protein